MSGDDLLVLRAGDVATLLAGREAEVVNLVREAYQAHGRGVSAVPHAASLTFPDHPANRILAMPAFLGPPYHVAGLKWIASFPGNVQGGLDRAAGVVVLNCATTGRPRALLEGSLISARRTAASAVVAATTLHRAGFARLGLIGAGLINSEIMGFFYSLFPELRTVMVHDLYPERTEAFCRLGRHRHPQLEVIPAAQAADVFREATLVSLATTMTTPHLFELGECSSETTILHISLRDLAPEVILTCDNVVDDIDHVCQSQTSVHLSEQRVGHRNFIRCSLSQLLEGQAAGRRADRTTVFSPFGLGILDLVIAQRVYQLACEQGLGTVIPGFLPAPWRTLDRPKFAKESVRLRSAAESAASR